MVKGFLDGLFIFIGIELIFLSISILLLLSILIFPKKLKLSLAKKLVIKGHISQIIYPLLILFIIATSTSIFLTLDVLNKQNIPSAGQFVLIYVGLTLVITGFLCNNPKKKAENMLILLKNIAYKYIAKSNRK